MPRLPRPVVPDIPLHIIQRGNNRQPCFFGDSDYFVYLDLLKAYAYKAGCRVHAYVLMTNHVHLLITPLSKAAPAAMMKGLGQRHVQYVNRRYSRSGSLWEGRYKSSLIEHEQYLLVCQRYIELNPVRARMVLRPSDYPWSSYRTNAHGTVNELITPHGVYMSLAHNEAKRERAYRNLFETAIPTSILNKVRRAANGNFALGNKRFTTEMAQRLGRDVIPRTGGRPRTSENSVSP